MGTGIPAAVVGDQACGEAGVGDVDHAHGRPGGGRGARDSLGVAGPPGGHGARGEQCFGVEHLGDGLEALAADVGLVDALHHGRGLRVGHEAGLALPSGAALRTDPQGAIAAGVGGAVGEVAVALPAVGRQPPVDAVLVDSLPALADLPGLQVGQGQGVGAHVVADRGAGVNRLGDADDLTAELLDLLQVRQGLLQVAAEPVVAVGSRCW